MSAFVKGKLKAARDAIGKKNWDTARDAALQILDYEPENYNANVFLGLSLLELGQNDQSEQVYRKAISINAEQLLAWQGLNRFYERTNNNNGYRDTLLKLAQLLCNANDAVKCAEAIQKYIELQRTQGSRLQLTEALALLLPDSPFYDALSSLPAPDPTNPTATTTFIAQSAIYNSLPILEEIVSLTERDESELIQKEVDKRRMRLGAPSVEQIRKDVDKEALGASKLPKLYDEVLNHPNTPDELRRETESKLFRHRQRYLHALPADKDGAALKAKVTDEVDRLADGMVLLGIPEELAWLAHIESRDTDSIKGYDFGLLRRYIGLFPSTPLSRLIHAYFRFSGLRTVEEDDDQEAERNGRNVEEEREVALADLMEFFASTPNSMLAHRILSEIYRSNDDYEDAIKVAESGLELVRRAAANRGRRLDQVRKAFNVVLSTSLVHLFPPKHHIRALRIIDDVLSQDPENIACLMGRGFIMQSANKWSDARDLFERVAALIPGDEENGLRAKEEAAWCQAELGDLKSARSALQGFTGVLDALDNRDLDKARCWWRLGKCCWKLIDEDPDEAYRCFITSLKRCTTYAPAFTSLGIHYAERADPPDNTRASKCFQKAFELDPREADAAQRLATGFAEEREWDLVDVVARRTIEGEGGLEGGIAGADRVAISRYLPTNVWAWKAVGVVELHRRNYPSAIQAFQIALRAEPDDQLSWLRLGEAYSKAGRYAAAVKALARAQELKPDDWMCTYLTGEVLRQTGQFTEAIESFHSVLAQNPSELGAIMALAQTYLDLGCSEDVMGFATRAELSFSTAIQKSLEAMECSAGFRRAAWKIVADALFELSRRSTYKLEDDVRSALDAVVRLVSAEVTERLAEIVSLSRTQNNSPLKGSSVLEVAIVAYDFRLSLGSQEDPGIGSAWADLGSALYAWTKSMQDPEKKARAQKQANSCMTEALRADPGNDAYWTALGGVNFLDHPKTAQHAYIKALEIDHKNVVTWTDLGLLYLYHNDAELANEALYRAQTLDPDYALAWVGQGLVATANGHDQDARTLFEHAVTLSSDVPEADLEFSTRLFNRFSPSTPTTKHAADDLIPAFFALDRYSRKRSDDASAAHLYGLVCERIGHLELGTELIGRAIAILESAYEESEDAAIERQFIIANTSMARLRLSLGEYEPALEYFQTALGLLAEGEEGEDASGAVLRAQCQFGAGLANFKLGQLEEALALFEAALAAAGENAVVHGQVTVLLAQTLWALGSEEGRESAKNHLLQCISADPENLTAINTLAGMGIVSEDDGLVDAALSEILALPLERRHELDPNKEVTYLLAQHQLSQGNLAGALSVYQSATFAEPSQADLRRHLTALTLQQSEPAVALAVIRGAPETNVVEDTRESSALTAVAESLAGDALTASGIAQRGVMLAPWRRQGWEALAYVRSSTAE